MSEAHVSKNWRNDDLGAISQHQLFSSAGQDRSQY